MNSMADQSRRANPHRLYRDTENNMIAGVCAGLANYLGFNVCVLRLLVIIGAIVFMPVAIVGYIVLAFLIPKRPAERPPLDEERARFWREVSNAPGDVFSSVRHRFRELDLRLQRMEAYVTSKEFAIDRELTRQGDPD